MNSEQRTVNSEQESDLSTVDCQLSTGRQIQALGRYVGQLAGMLMALEKEVESMKRDNGRRISVNHQQALALNRLIRLRAQEICEKYALDPKMHAGAFRSAIKKDVLKLHGIRDLHDLPLGELDAARVRICAFSSYSLVVKRRAAETAGKREHENNA